jgi:hypothetical protein
MRLAKSGFAATCLPIQKNVAEMFSRRSQSSRAGVTLGSGPSSNVSATHGCAGFPPQIARQKNCMPMQVIPIAKIATYVTAKTDRNHPRAAPWSKKTPARQAIAASIVVSKKRLI